MQIPLSKCNHPSHAHGCRQSRRLIKQLLIDHSDPEAHKKEIRFVPYLLPFLIEPLRDTKSGLFAPTTYR